MIGARLPGLAGPLSRLVPARLAGAAFRSGGGVFVASPPSITPTLSGIELVTNGTFDTNLASWGTTDSGSDGSWTVAGGVASLSAGATNTSYNDGIAQAVAITTGTWWRFTGRFAKGGAKVAEAFIYSAGNSSKYLINLAVVPASLTAYTTVFRGIASENMTIYIRPNKAVGDVDVLQVDDISVRAISLPSTLGTPYDIGADGDFKVTLPALTAGTQAGQFFCVDNQLNPRNFGLIYHDGTNLTMLKCLNGAYTNLFTPVAAAYGATKPLWLSKRGPTVTAYYGGVKIGTGAIPEDAIRNNTIVAPFSTYSGNTFANLDLQAA